MNDLLSEIRSLLEKEIEVNRIYHAEDVVDFIDKAIEKLKPLMAHLQPENRPQFDKPEAPTPMESLIVSRGKCIEYFKELDKRTANPENYVCVPLSVIDKVRARKIKIDMLPNPMGEMILYNQQAAEDFNREIDEILELLQPSTKAKGEKQ